MTTIDYSPGLHKLVTLEVQDLTKLTSSENFISFSKNLIAKYQLEKVGISEHIFENNSFTIAICLKESHICIHTWPEINTLTMDVYLCNYSQDNSNKVRSIAKDFIAYFEENIVKQIEVER